MSSGTHQFRHDGTGQYLIGLEGGFAPLVDRKLSRLP